MSIGYLFKVTCQITNTNTGEVWTEMRDNIAALTEAAAIVKLASKLSLNKQGDAFGVWYNPSQPHHYYRFTAARF